jgi:hypothetical protein
MLPVITVYTIDQRIQWTTFFIVIDASIFH